MNIHLIVVVVVIIIFNYSRACVLDFAEGRDGNKESSEGYWFKKCGRPMQ
jgi:hypothetical protein